VFAALAVIQEAGKQAGFARVEFILPGGGGLSGEPLQPWCDFSK
jgi:hypothetical protein